MKLKHASPIVYNKYFTATVFIIMYTECSLLKNSLKLITLLIKKKFLIDLNLITFEQNTLQHNLL